MRAPQGAQSFGRKIVEGIAYSSRRGTGGATVGRRVGKAKEGRKAHPFSRRRNAARRNAAFVRSTSARDRYV